MFNKATHRRCTHKLPCLFLVLGILATASFAGGLEGPRQYQPLVLLGSSVPAFLGVPVGELAMFSYSATADTWTLVPFQIDERVLAPDPWDPGSERLLYFAADDSLLDSDDELVFMVKDLGDQAPANVWPGWSKGFSSVRVEVVAEDPLTGQSAWGYIYRVSPYFGSSTAYAFSYDPELDQVTTAAYQVRFGHETGLVEDMAVLPPWGTGVDFFDTQKIRMVGLLTVFSLSLPFGRDWNPQAANERDNLFVYRDSTRVTPKPIVRLVRRALHTIKFGVYVFDDARFPVVTKFYPYSVALAGGADLSNLGESVDVELDLPRQSWDFNAAATGMHWMNRHNNDVLIDGVPDHVDRTVDLPIREWFAATGDQGTLLTYVRFADTLGEHQELYYLDDKNGGQADGTQVDGGDTGQDSVSYGDIGILATGRSARPNLRLDFQAYFLPGNLSRAEVEALVQAMETPLHVRTDVQNYGASSVVGSGQQLPLSFSLGQPFPNPFNSSTQIVFTLPSQAHVQAVVVDQLGRTRRVLLNQMLGPGKHRLVWDGRDKDGTALPSGTYLLHVRADQGTASRQLILLR